MGVTISEHRRIAAIHLALLLTFLASACSGAAEPDVKFDTVDATLKDKPFKLEVADTDARRERGLMFRDSMPADHGMIFVFDKPDKWGFWMKNTKIPLDLVFLDEKGKVTGIHALKPADETIVYSKKDAKFAIELNAGAAKQLGLKEGDLVTLPGKLLKVTVRSDDK